MKACCDSKVSRDRGIVLFAHGSHGADWAAPFDALARRVADKSGSARVAVAYLEILSPALEEAVASLIADGVREITIAPLFLAPGGHVKRDLPRIVAVCARATRRRTSAS